MVPESSCLSLSIGTNIDADTLCYLSLTYDQDFSPLGVSVGLSLTYFVKNLGQNLDKVLFLQVTAKRSNNILTWFLKKQKKRNKTNVCIFPLTKQNEKNKS